MTHNNEPPKNRLRHLARDCSVAGTLWRMDCWFYHFINHPYSTVIKEEVGTRHIS